MPRHNQQIHTRNDVRHVRVESAAKPQILSEDAQSWAISYSDMLMVLMSFFIIFFSFDDKKPEEIVDKIALEIKGQLPVKEEVAKPILKNEKLQGPAEDIKKIAELFTEKSFKILTSRNSRFLRLDLSDQLYSKRSFKISGKAKIELESVLKLLEPYKKSIKIVFIGHSDKSNVSKANQFLSNNLDLSALRAVRALEFASFQGFPMSQLATETEGPVKRDSRSLSLKITQL